VGGLANLVHIVGTHHFIPLATALTRKQAAISIYIRHHTLKPYCTTRVCEAVTQDEDGEDQSVEDPNDTPEDEIDVVLMDLHKVTQWEQYEKERARATYNGPQHPLWYLTGTTCQSNPSVG